MTRKTAAEKKIDLSIIRYSQCWEDPACLYAGLDIGPEDDVLSITSAGCNTLALLLKGPRSVTALDFNPAQSHLLQLKVGSHRLTELPALPGTAGRGSVHETRPTL